MSPLNNLPGPGGHVGGLLAPEHANTAGARVPPDAPGPGAVAVYGCRPAPARPRPARSPMVPAEPALTTADAVRSALAGLSDGPRAERTARYLHAVPGGYGQGDPASGAWPSRRSGPSSIAPPSTATSSNGSSPAPGTRSGWPRCSSPWDGSSGSTGSWTGRSPGPAPAPRPRRPSGTPWPGARRWDGATWAGRSGACKHRDGSRPPGAWSTTATTAASTCPSPTPGDSSTRAPVASAGAVGSSLRRRRRRTPLPSKPHHHDTRHSITNPPQNPGRSCKRKPRCLRRPVRGSLAAGSCAP